MKILSLRFFLFALLQCLVSISVAKSHPSSMDVSEVESIMMKADSLQTPVDTLLHTGTSATHIEKKETSMMNQDSLTHPIESNKTGLSSIKGVMYELPSQLFSRFRNLSKPQIALLCNIIPGGGQLYNKKYWKVPLVLTLATGCAYAISRFGGQYNEYHTAYRDFMSENPMQYDSWKAFIPSGNDPSKMIGDGNLKSRLKKGNDFYRRYRDLSIMLSCVVYLLTFVDAYVDAQFADFDISPNLSMLTPETLTSGSADWKTPTLGVSIRF